jgi:hypothetical protein
MNAELNEPRAKRLQLVAYALAAHSTSVPMQVKARVTALSLLDG